MVNSVTRGGEVYLNSPSKVDRTHRDIVINEIDAVKPSGSTVTDCDRCTRRLRVYGIGEGDRVGRVGIKPLAGAPLRPLEYFSKGNEFLQIQLFAP